MLLYLRKIIPARQQVGETPPHIMSGAPTRSLKVGEQKNRWTRDFPLFIMCICPMCHMCNGPPSSFPNPLMSCMVRGAWMGQHVRYTPSCAGCKALFTLLLPPPPLPSCICAENGGARLMHCVDMVWLTRLGQCGMADLWCGGLYRQASGGQHGKPRGTDACVIVACWFWHSPGSVFASRGQWWCLTMVVQRTRWVWWKKVTQMTGLSEVMYL